MTANIEEGNMAAEERFVFGDRVLWHGCTGLPGLEISSVFRAVFLINTFA